MAAVTRGGTRLGSMCVSVVHLATASNSDVSWCKLGSSWVLATSSNGSATVVGLHPTVGRATEVGLWARRAWWKRARSERAALRDPSRCGVDSIRHFDVSHVTVIRPKLAIKLARQR